ncbi:MGH1-like glycoside hydrolase domain-containing protein [Azotobacter salinestris]|uniref:alpha-L-rhamnosidase-related protein n=1 Tax=Azotobacter salinestris TaxID=69964 RepID=UPI0032DE528A
MFRRKYLGTTVMTALALSLASLYEGACAAGSPAAGTGKDSMVFPPYALEPSGRDETVSVSVTDPEAAQRTYTISTTMDLRDNAEKQRVFTESAGHPLLRSGSLMFDGLFAMAMDDLQLLSVSEIRDGSYNAGEPIDCNCFQTGEKWTYVWTRDLSYAARLGLAGLYPERVINSLFFKSSGFREGVSPPASLPKDSLQIVQDTGSGGSWPVSTDRVTWALAAESALDSLSGEAYDEFSDYAYAALRGTVEADRQAAFDPLLGLYGGEQSYLDWRTQTYAGWIVDNLSHMSESKALSTNVVHYQALRLTARLAMEHGDALLAQRYEDWAEALKEQINKHFWLEEAGLYASLTGATEDQAPVEKFDMLGSALAILSGIAPPQRAAEVLANYPHGQLGVPVYYPQQPDIAVYHNRALWPFVTAYELQAAAKVRNTAVADNAIQSLVRGAALNISNMENLEWLTGKPFYDDGPVINSPRQLWSVAGYLNMVIGTLFGYRVDQSGITVDPFLTAKARQLFGDSPEARLTGLRHKGHPLEVVLKLPETMSGTGYYMVQTVRLNGTPVTGVIEESQLNGMANVIEVEFGGLQSGDARITLAPAVDPRDHRDPRVFAPVEPQVTSVEQKDGKYRVHFIDNGNSGISSDSVHYRIFRNGKLVDGRVTQTSWTDRDRVPAGARVCYAVQAVFSSSGHHSHHSAPFCAEEAAVQVIPVTDTRVLSNVTVTPPSDGIVEPTLRDWGAPTDTLEIRDISIAEPGRYAIELVYNNHQYDINTGVTNAVKQLDVLSGHDKVVASGILQMPHVDPRNEEQPLRTSTEVVADLKPGTYRLMFKDYFNMSYLESNGTYAGSGGTGGPVNRASIAKVRIVKLGRPDLR